MAEGRWLIEDKDENEGIVERIVVAGKLVLETPAHFGNGEVSVLSDMPLLRDPLEGRALLTGASIAGALRNYLREYEKGYGAAETDHSRVAHIFGGFREDEPGQQIAHASLLIVDDALGQWPQTELRDGVTIDPKTHTAKEKLLYNIELLPPGTTFDLVFELAIPQGHDGGRLDGNVGREQLVESLALILRGLQTGEIRLGKRKRRGFGQCRVSNWHITRYKLDTSEDLLAWLERPLEAKPALEETGINSEVLLQTAQLPEDKRQCFTLQASFALDSSLLIRSAFGQANAPDTVHLHSGGKPVLSGTSLAGALRARALKIANTLKLDHPQVFIDGIFGDRSEDDNAKEKGTTQKRLQASRLIVSETAIKKSLEMVQSRLKIDRFTGGAYPGALFSEQPVFGTPETRLEIELSLIQPKAAEIGLLLMLLKDLWTGDLPLGGEASIGRGRLSGRGAVLGHNGQTWQLRQRDDRLIVDTETTSALKPYTDALKEMARWNEN